MGFNGTKKKKEKKIVGKLDYFQGCISHIPLSN